MADGTGGGGNGALIGVGVVVLLGIAGGVLYFAVKKPDAPVPSTTTTTTTSASTTNEPETNLDLPPVAIPVDAGPEDTGVDAGDGKKTPNGVAMGGCTSCSGAPTDALSAAVKARAATAKQCYKTALEGNEGLSGTISLTVTIGPSGQTCGVAVTGNSTGSTRLQQCALGKMYGSYPQPKGGCTSVTVPIQFSPKM